MGEWGGVGGGKPPTAPSKALSLRLVSFTLGAVSAWPASSHLVAGRSQNRATLLSFFNRSMFPTDGFFPFCFASMPDKNCEGVKKMTELLLEFSRAVYSDCCLCPSI